MKKQTKRVGRSKLLRTILYGAVSFIIMYALLLLGITPDTYDIQVGQPSSKTIYATKDVEDTVTTEELRNAAASTVEPSYKSVDTSVNSVVIENINGMFSALSDLRSSFKPDEGDRISSELLLDINIASPIAMTGDTATAVLTCSEEEFEAIMHSTINCVQDTLNSTLPEGQENTAITRISRSLVSEGHRTGLITAAADIMRACVQPNMLIDTDITEANRQAARDGVEPVIRVKREVIVRQGEIVTNAQYQMIASLGLLNDNKLDWPMLIGIALMILTLFVLIALYIRMFRPALQTDSKKILILCIIVLVNVCLCILTRELNAYLMPVALCAILITTLIEAKTAMFVGSLMSFVVAMLVSSDSLFSSEMFSVMLITFASAPIAAVLLNKRTQRSSTLIAGLVIGAVNMLLTMAIGFIGNANINTTFTDSLWAFGGGLLSAVLALGLQALFEIVFNLPTSARLIELSNPNQPILRRLLMEAPGTYHHSIIVANLAEAGTTAVGGNGLLARVGAYYHDIGKFKRPMYFKENQMGDNPHDRTDPRVSAAILTAHTRDGVLTAQKERLPQQIQDIIRQHHGTSPCLFFYDKAVKLYGDDISIDAFRYDGPRPNSKEAAVVMLADTIEAATRSLTNPNPERMEQLIRTLVRKKMDDGQLNECALTFADLEKICLSFSTVLTGVFHERIEYPDVAIPTKILSPEELEKMTPENSESQTAQEGANADTSSCNSTEAAPTAEEKPAEASGNAD